MREALARSDLDFSVSEQSPSSESRPARLPTLLRRAAVSTACVVGAVIVLNALFLQDRKHPAPLLQAPDIRENVERLPSSPVVVPVSRPTMSTTQPTVNAARKGRDPIAEEIARLELPTPVQRRQPVKLKDQERTDPIASLIVASPQPSASVLASQRALVRLGYVLQADGVAGLSTRQAIEQFERDNRLPVRGELTPQRARDLAARSSVAR